MELQCYPVERLKKEILHIVGKYLPIEGCSLFFFGSRVTGMGDERSDIDIGLEGSTVVPYEIMAAIKEDVENLPTLYKIDMVDFKGVSPSFRAVALQAIERICGEGPSSGRGYAMKVVILCGGLGTRLREETEYKPKPMVEIGGKPILWHIMKSYAHYGFTDFVLCLGYKGDIIRDYFYNYETHNSDSTIEFGTRNIVTHGFYPEKGWKVTLAETGKSSMTGSRVKQVSPYIDGDTFLLTYGDGLCDVNIRELVDYHQSHGKIGTVTGVLPPSRFGELVVDQSTVVQFSEKPQMHGGGMINGGYFVFNRKFLQYLSDDEACILERDPIEHLVKDGQLQVFRHERFWQCMDTYRDMEYLNGLWAKGEATWKVWP